MKVASQEHTPTLVYRCTASSSLVREMLVDVAALLAPLSNFEAMSEGIRVDAALLLTLFFRHCSVAYYPGVAIYSTERGHVVCSKFIAVARVYLSERRVIVS